MQRMTSTRPTRSMHSKGQMKYKKSGASGWTHRFMIDDLKSFKGTIP